VFEPLREQAQVIAARPQHLDDIAAPATEHEDMAAEKIGFERCLHLRSQAIEAGPHIGHAGSDLDAYTRRQTHHARRLWKILASIIASACHGRGPQRR
jgi:hypothetical protein